MFVSLAFATVTIQNKGGSKESWQVETNIFHFTAAIGACEKTGHWFVALQLLERMHQARAGYTSKLQWIQLLMFWFLNVYYRVVYVCIYIYTYIYAYTCECMYCLVVWLKFYIILLSILGDPDEHSFHCQVGAKVIGRCRRKLERTVEPWLSRAGLQFVQEPRLVN